MLSITTRRIDIDDSTVDVEIIVTASPTSAGIQHVDVLNFNRNVLDARDFECPRFVHYRIENIPRFELPIYVVATECIDPNNENPPEITVGGPFLNEDRAEPGLSTVVCRPLVVDMPNENNAACIAANAEAQAIRNQIAVLCGEAANLRRQRDEAAAVAAAAYTAAIALAAAAAGASSIPIIGSILMVVLLVAAAIALLVGIAASIAAADFSSQLDGKLREITEAQREYSDVVSRIQNVCCPEFINVDLDAPSC